MDILFISDLHLSEERPHTVAAFLVFLKRACTQVKQLYILGDLFDAWIGDDDDRPLVSDIARALSALSRQGVALYFQHGNRDFLLGADYAARCGMTLLPEQVVVMLGKQLCLLAHGDQFCTDDEAYQQFRATVRNPQWQTSFLAQTLPTRRAIAADLRSRSREANSIKSQDITDVSTAAIESALQQAGVSLLLHGHTHRPGSHAGQYHDVPAVRHVLGEWDDGVAWIARWRSDHGLALERWAFPAE